MKAEHSPSSVVSSYSPYTTGQVLIVDGGLTLT
jgi:hypothetical protein